jgi:hypothetical protein
MFFSKKVSVPAVLSSASAGVAARQNPMNSNHRTASVPRDNRTPAGQRLTV